MPLEIQQETKTIHFFAGKAERNSMKNPGSLEMEALSPQLRQ